MCLLICFLLNTVDYLKKSDLKAKLIDYTEKNNSNEYIIKFFVGEVGKKGNRGKGKNGLIRVISAPSL